MSQDTESSPPTTGTTLADLKNILLRLDAIDHEMQPLKEELRDTFAAAKEKGFNPKLIRKLVSLRRQATDEARAELDTLATWIETLR